MQCNRQRSYIAMLFRNVRFAVNEINFAFAVQNT